MKTNYLKISLLSVSVTFFANAQVKVGQNPTVINAGSLLELEHTSSSPKALTLPRMTTTEMNAILTPINGMFIYNITENCVHQYRTTGGWTSMCNTSDPTFGAAPAPGSTSANKLWPYHTYDQTIGKVGNKQGIIALPGNNQIADGENSHSEGSGTQAIGAFNWAIMKDNYSYGSNSFTMGEKNTNYGIQSFVTGSESFVDIGVIRATNFGYKNQFLTKNCYDAFSAGGAGNVHTMPATISFGTANKMNVFYSFAVGTSNEFNGTGNYLNTFGKSNILDGSLNFVGGEYNKIEGLDNFTYGSNNIMAGEANASVGKSNILAGAYNFTSGIGNETKNFYNFMSGSSNKITSDASAAIGASNTVGSAYSMAVGIKNATSFPLAYSFGENNNVASIGMAVGQGNKIGTEAIGRPGFAYGSQNTLTDAAYSFAFGQGNNLSSGFGMIGMGEKNNLKGDRTFVLSGGGFNNITNPTGASAWPTGTIGAFNKIEAEGAMIFGYNAALTTRGSIGFADLSVGTAETPFPGAIDNSFNARYNGGYQLFSNAAQTTGAALAPGASAWTALSDRTSKENIRANTYGLNELMQLGTYSYNYIGNPTSKRNLGVMAQDVQTLMPELVSNMAGGKLGVVSTEMIPVLINAIKELQAQIEELKARK